MTEQRLGCWIRGVPKMYGLVLIAFVAACRAGDDSPGSPFEVAIVAGANQTVPVGSVAPIAPSVKVRDASGNGLAGTSVKFTVRSGGGNVFGDSVVTDAQGVATVGEWIVGTTTGIDTLEAAASGVPGVAYITATAVPGSPASMIAASTQNVVALVAHAVTPAPVVEVHDAYGNRTPGVVVTFAVTLNSGSIAGATATTNAQGQASVGSWTLSPNAGLNRITASTSNGTSFVFQAEGLAGQPTLAATSPTNQAGYLSFPVTQIPRVLVTDASGNPLPSVPVTFAVSAGDATLSGPVGVSGSDGVASPSDWRLGPTGTASTVTATVAGFASAPVTFHATGVPAVFLIDLRFLTTLDANQRDAFVAAARRWMRIITAPIPTTQVTLPAGACANGLSPAMNETVSGVVIYAVVAFIDGVGGILGSSGPCVQRSGSFFTAVGQMRFDQADFVGLETTGQLTAVVTHEMAHVLGYGTAWTQLGLTQGIGGVDPIFIGGNALAMWPLFTLGYSGRPVPLENQGPTGTRDVHWRKYQDAQDLVPLFGPELMTGYIEPPGVFTPLSKMSIASMQDLGYQVDYSQADPFAGNLLAPQSNFGVPTPLNETLVHATWEVTPERVTRRIQPF